MASATVTTAIEPAVSRWTLLTRMAFRFCSVYFPLRELTIGSFPNPVDPYAMIIPDPATHWPTREIVSWVGAHVLHFNLPLASTPEGGGDRTFDFALLLCLAAIAFAVTAVWSVLDNRREEYRTLYQWFRLLLRFELAVAMLTYGVSKVAPLQMPFPRLVQLIRPFGTMPPQGVLWASVGAAPLYETFAGCAEVLGEFSFSCREPPRSAR
jgi:hypothetical protein